MSPFKSRCIQPSVKPDEMLLLLQTYHELLLLQVHYSKTLTEHDIKHIERHLSMKRTIRKKIMRDLQQAFVQVILSYMQLGWVFFLAKVICILMLFSPGPHRA